MSTKSVDTFGIFQKWYGSSDFDTLSPTIIEVKKRPFPRQATHLPVNPVFPLNHGFWEKEFLSNSNSRRFGDLFYLHILDLFWSILGGWWLNFSDHSRFSQAKVQPKTDTEWCVGNLGRKNCQEVQKWLEDVVVGELIVFKLPRSLGQFSAATY